MEMMVTQNDIMAQKKSQNWSTSWNDEASMEHSIN